MTEKDAGALLTAYVNAIVGGPVPTNSTFPCPACGREAAIFASPHRNDRLAVRISCCCEIEMDGVEKGAGWERIAVASREWP